MVTESPRPLEVKEDLQFLLQLYKGVGLIATCLRPIMVQELKEGEKQYKRWKKRRWRRRHRGVLRRQQRRRLRSAGIGKKWRRVFRRAEMSVQFYLPFFIQSFLSLIRRTAGYILSRRKPCCLMTKNEREIDVVFTTILYNQLHRYTIHIDLELKIQIRNIFSKICEYSLRFNKWAKESFG